MGINAVKYNLSKYDGRLCSTCELFTNKDISFVPVSRIVTDGGINAVIEYYKNLGEKYFSKLIDMLVFDAVVCNTDRHFGNFGFLVDNHSNKIVDVAPIFDNGLSLCSFAMDDDFENIEAYANTRTPAAYNDFVGFLKPYIGGNQKTKIKKLTDFVFEKHPRYNWNKKRLYSLEKLVGKRAKILLTQ